MDKKYVLKMYGEIMAHILTIENMLIGSQNLDREDFETILNFNRTDVEKQLKI